MFLPGTLLAQSATTGAMAGLVADTTGAVLPGLTVGAAVPPNRQDVGGSTGEFTSAVSIHGIGGNESITRVDGVSVQAMIGTGGGGSRWLKANQLMTQEVTLQTGGISAESETGGFVANVIYKDGGNDFRLTSLGNYASDKLQASNF